MNNKIKQNITALSLCAAGIAVNIVLGMVVASLGLPLYLDTVGTVAVAVMGGFLPGVFVGFVTNIIKSITDPSSLYYGILNVLIAVAAAYLAKRGCFKKISGIFFVILVFTFIGGGLGALIPWFMEGLSFDSESLSGVLYQTGYFNLYTSHLCSSLLMDLPDKFATVIIVLIIVRLIPKKYRDHFSFNMWLQKPIEKSSDSSEKTQVRILSLRTKTLLVLIFALVTVAVVGAYISLKIYHRSVVDEHTGLAKGTAKLASQVIDADHVNDYLANNGDFDGYDETKQLLEKILYSSPEITYLYVYKMEEDGFRVVFDIDTEDTPAGTIGDLIPYDDSFTPYIPKLLKGQDVEPIITNDEYGYLLTAAAPVYDSEGKCQCYAIADVDMERIIAGERSFQMEMTSVFMGFFILICTFTISLINYHMIIPINSVVSSMDKIAHNSETQESMDKNVKEFIDIGIHTGDELENLYNSAKSMTNHQTEQLRSIRLLSDTNERAKHKLQSLSSEVMEALASAIDAKDVYTHGHSSRVAEYSRKIAQMHGMPEDECDEVYYAALLHDVGKIGVPDHIINKKGRLTDEEFAAIKQHPVIGNQILSTIDEYPYLSIGAHYHHERYDGKGYPDGLKGDDIPVIARIIAVADAYDAMTSTRSYRYAIPQQMVREEIVKCAGTQFDPVFAKIMQHLIDMDIEYEMSERYTDDNLNNRSSLDSAFIGDSITAGLQVLGERTKLSFKYRPLSPDNEEYTPAIILFDSLDGRYHDEERTIKDLVYFEYGTLWLDGKNECTGARKIQVETNVYDSNTLDNKNDIKTCEITTARYKDHARVTIDTGSAISDFIIALPDCSRFMYVGLTGDNCHFFDMSAQKTDEIITEEDIPRIAEEISFINVPCGDVENIQIDGYRTASTEGIPVTDGLTFNFHTMSLPTARLVWHCPFVILYHSSDRTLTAPDYKEYALIRLDGENWDFANGAKNKTIITNGESFTDWENWKNINKQGVDCKVSFTREGNCITTYTENADVNVKNITTLSDPDVELYAILTGDQCALTDIRIKK